MGLLVLVFPAGRVDATHAVCTVPVSEIRLSEYLIKDDGGCVGGSSFKPDFSTIGSPPATGTFTFTAGPRPVSGGTYSCRLKTALKRFDGSDSGGRNCDLSSATATVNFGQSIKINWLWQTGDDTCSEDGDCEKLITVKSGSVPYSGTSPSPAPLVSPTPTTGLIPQAISSPAPTQQPTVSGPSRIAPAILTPANGTTLTGANRVDIRATEGSVVELRLQPSQNPSGTLHLGLVKVATGQTTVSYNWETKNTPNGRYKLYAVVTEPGNSQIIVGPVEVTLDNSAAAVVIAQKLTATPAPTTKPLATSQPVQMPTPAVAQSEIVTETIADIVFPSQFSSEQVKVDNNTKITKIENEITSTGEMTLKISGQTFSNKVITILIYSSPIVVTVKTDANGVWSYQLEKPLSPGKHIVYTVVPRVGGGKVRSEVSSFFISPVYAASTNNESLVLASATSDEPLKRFALITATVVAVGVAGLLLTFRFFKKKDTPLSK